MFRALVWPCVQTVTRIPLNTMTCEIPSKTVYTSQGVPISVAGVAQVIYFLTLISTYLHSKQTSVNKPAIFGLIIPGLIKRCLLYSYVRMCETRRATTFASAFIWHARERVRVACCLVCGWWTRSESLFSCSIACIHCIVCSGPPGWMDGWM